MAEIIKGSLSVDDDGMLYERVVIDDDAEWLRVGDIEDGVDDPDLEDDYRWLLSEYRDAKRQAGDYEREVCATWASTKGLS